MADLPDKDPADDEDLRKRVLDNLDALDRRGKLRALDFTYELAAENESRRPRDTRKALLALVSLGIIAAPRELVSVAGGSCSLPTATCWLINRLLGAPVPLWSPEE